MGLRTSQRQSSGETNQKKIPLPHTVTYQSTVASTLNYPTKDSTVMPPAIIVGRSPRSPYLDTHQHSSPNSFENRGGKRRKKLGSHLSNGSSSKSDENKKK